MTEEEALKQLTGALDGHSITDENGQIMSDDTQLEETDEEITNPEPNTEEESIEDTTQETEETDSDDPVEDESGKKYVPEDRFKKVYGKAKEEERRNAMLQKELEILRSQKNFAPSNNVMPDKADVLELKLTLPEFNPESDKYNAELDEIAGEIFRANKGITPIQAAKKAMTMVEKIAKQFSSVKTDNRIIKIQSEGSMSANSNSRNVSEAKNPNDMNDRELEAYLRKTGQW